MRASSVAEATEATPTRLNAEVVASAASLSDPDSSDAVSDTGGSEEEEETMMQRALEATQPGPTLDRSRTDCNGLTDLI